MAIHLGPNQYGKAESRLVRIYRDTPRHQIRDLNVSTALRGGFEAAHISGDQQDVLPTDTQKNTVFALAKEKGVGSIEEFALTLADHFIATVAGRRGRAGRGRGVLLAADPRRRRRARPLLRPERRRACAPPSSTSTAPATTAGRTSISGIEDLTVLKSTGSEFHGFLKDKYTTLQETDDRILATSLIARWRYAAAPTVDWDKSYDAIKALLLQRFAEIHSLRPAADASTAWARRCSSSTPRSPRSGSPRPTSTTSSSTSRRSGWTTPARSSSPPTGPTG